MATQITTIFTQTASVTVGGTGTETTVIGTGSGTNTLPAAYLTAGKTFRVVGGGILSTKAAATGNLTIRLKIGSTTIATATITTLLASATNQGYSFDATVVCRTTGATGTVMTTGSVVFPSAAASWDFADLNNAGATATIDTTVANTLNITAQWATSDASNTLTQTNLLTIVQY